MSVPRTWAYDHPHPAIAADIMVLGYALDVGRLGVLLIERGEEPFKGAWALPGGFLRPDETIEQCAQRELAEEAGVDTLVELIGTFSDPGRDPRERVVSIAWFACVDHTACRPRAGSDAAATNWHLIDELPEMAFDHAEIIKAGMERVRKLARTGPIAGRLLPPSFTLTELQHVQEALLGHP